jgi:hypothetical protein
MSDQSLKDAPSSASHERHAYAALIARLSPDTHAYLATLDPWLGDHGAPKSVDPASIPHPDDVDAALPRARIEELVHEHVRGRALAWFELARNVFLILPIIFTWLSLSLASAAFEQTIASYALAPGQVPPTFQQLWERGFEIPSVDWGLIRHIPLRQVRADGTEWRWFSFSFVAGADAGIVAVLGILIVYTQFAQRRANARGIALMDAFDADVRAIRSGLRRHHMELQRRNEQVSRIAITESLDGFTREAANVVRTMTDGANIFRSAAEARLRGDADLVAASATFVRGAEDLQTMRDAVLALQAILAEQAEVRASLDSVGSNLAGVSQGLIDGGLRVGDAAAAITRSHEAAIRHLEAGIASETKIAEGARSLEQTTKLLSDVLLQAGTDAASANRDILASNETFRAAMSTLVELLSARLESATSLQVTSVQRADAAGRQLEQIALDLVEAQRRLASESQQLVTALQAILARRLDDGLRP